MSDDGASGCADLPVLRCHCHALRQAARRATGLYDAVMAPFGLRISQFAILKRLGQSGPLTLQVLADLLVLDRTTLGRNLRPLERDGLISSEGDAADRRVRRVAVTEAGAELVRRAMPAWREAQVAFEQRFGVASAAALRGELERLTVVLGGSQSDSVRD